MQSLEPVLYALTADPATARPGAAVTLRFAARNRAAAAIPAGSVRFTLPDGCDATDESVTIPETAPGATVSATLAVRLGAGLADGEVLAFAALAQIGADTYATNVCRVTVRSRPVLDGPRSGVVLHWIDERTIGVTATVANEGDGPAFEVRVAAPPPPGCAVVPGESTTLAVARLDPGAEARLAYAATVTFGGERLEALDASVTCAGGVREPLAARNTLVLAAELAEPLATLRTDGNRLELRVEIENRGWRDASDVLVEIALPRSVRPIDGWTTVDGAALRNVRRRGAATAVARCERRDESFVVTLARVAARSTTHIVVAATAGAPSHAHTIRVACGGSACVATLATQPRRALRLRVVTAPRTVAPDDAAQLAVEVCNAGDATESFVLSGTCDGAVSEHAVELASSSLATIPFAFAPSAAGADGDVRRFSFVGRGDDGAPCTETLLHEVAMRDGAFVVLAAPPRAGDGSVRYALRNRGDGPARALRLRSVVREESLGDLAPDSGTIVTLSAAEAASGAQVLAGARVALLLPACEPPVHARVGCILTGPQTVGAGAAFGVTATIDVAAALPRLRLRSAVPCGAAYVAGSTTLDGRALLDRDGACVLDGDGLTLYDVPAGARIVAAWSLLAAAERAEPLTVAAAVDDGAAGCAAEPLAVEVRAAKPFATRPTGLAYFVDAYARDDDADDAADAADAAEVVVNACEELAAPACERAAAGFSFTLRLDSARRAHIARLLRGAPPQGLAGHLLLVRAFFPDSIESGEPALQAAFDDAAEAVRSVFDRLFVKLRIPGFGVEAGDLEDAQMRRALTTFFGALLAAEPAHESAGGCTAYLPADAVRAFLSSFADAPHGSPDAMRALLALMPTLCDDQPHLTAALQGARGALDEALLRCAAAGARAFDEALEFYRDDALGDAHRAVAAALHAEPAAGLR